MLSFLKRIKDTINGYLYTNLIRPYLEWDSKDRYSEFNMTPVEKYEPKHGDVLIKLTRTASYDIFNVNGIELYPINSKQPFVKHTLRHLFKMIQDGSYFVNQITALTIEFGGPYNTTNVYIGQGGKNFGSDDADITIFSVLHEGSSYVDKINKLINMYHIRMRTTMESAYNYAQPIGLNLIKPDSVVIFKNGEHIITGVYKNIQMFSISFSDYPVSTDKNDECGIMKHYPNAMGLTNDITRSIRLSDTKSYERIKSIRDELYQKLYEFTVAEMQDERNKRYEQ